MSFVIDVLEGRVYLEPDQNDRTELDPLLHLWRGNRRRDELLAGFIEALTHTTPRIRAAGVRFFAQMTTGVVHLDLLLDLLENHKELYEDVPDSFAETGADLRSILASAVAFRAPPGHRALEVLKAEALEPGRAGWVIAGIVPLDSPWLRRNAATIINGSPDALDPLLFNLGLRGIDATNFLIELRPTVDDDVLRGAIRSALGGKAADVEAAVFAT